MPKIEIITPVFLSGRQSKKLKRKKATQEIVRKIICLPKKYLSLEKEFIVISPAKEMSKAEKKRIQSILFKNIFICWLKISIIIKRLIGRKNSANYFNNFRGFLTNRIGNFCINIIQISRGWSVKIPIFRARNSR